MPYTLFKPVTCSVSGASQVTEGWKGQWPEASTLSVRRATVQKTKLKLKCGENSNYSLPPFLFIQTFVHLTNIYE